PRVVVGAAAGLGLLGARLLRRRDSPRDRLLNTLTSATEDLSRDIRRVLQGARQPRPSAMGALLRSAAGLLLSQAWSAYQQAAPAEPRRRQPRPAEEVDVQ